MDSQRFRSIRPVEDQAHLRLLSALRAADAGRVSDSLILPITEGGPRYAASGVVRVREHDGRMWIRVADVPFDLLPATVRPLSPGRDGTFFSLGPGVTVGGASHPGVLLVQVEGTPATASARLAALRPLLRELSAVREVRLATVPGRWDRVCIGALVD